jgi:predicted Zn-dependent protease
MRRLVDGGAQISSRMELEEANYLRRASHFDECLALVRDLVTEHGDHPALANIEGLVHARLGRDTAALACFKRAVDLAPSNAVLVGNYGSQLADRNDLDGAVAALKRAIAINPELAYVHVALADVYRRQGDEPSAERELTQAAAVLRRAMAERPLDPDLLWEFAGVQDSLGEYQGAEAARSAARELERNALVGGDSNLMIASAHGRRSWRSVR